MSRWHAPSAPIEIGRTTSTRRRGAVRAGRGPAARPHLTWRPSAIWPRLIVSRQPSPPPTVRGLEARGGGGSVTVLDRPRRERGRAGVRGLAVRRPAWPTEERAGRYVRRVPADGRPAVLLQPAPDVQPAEFPSLHDEVSPRVGIVGEQVAVGNVVELGALPADPPLPVAVVVAILLPPGRRFTTCRRASPCLGSAYFLLIGLGFMFVEIGLIQRMSVFLGQPITPSASSCSA